MDLDSITNFLKEFNVQTISSMALVVWYFTKTYHDDLKKDIKGQTDRTDKLYEMYIELQKQTKDELLSLRKEQFEMLKEGRK